MIKSPRLTIRSIDESQAQKIMETVNDGNDMTAYLKALPEDAVQSAFQDMDGLFNFVQSLVSLRNSPDIKRFGAWNQDNELVAHVGITGWSSKTPELQITVAQNYQRLCYGTEFLQSLLPRLFQSFDIRFFVYRLRKDNIPSEKIAHRLDGILQEPHSALERLALKTYHIYPN